MKKRSGSKRYEAFHKIKNLILDHQLHPGQRLIYHDLEEKLGMTQTPIISGLTILEKEGFVVSKRNRGFYVSEVNADEAEQILDLREKLEELILEYAIKNYDCNDLLILEEKLNAYQEYESEVYDNKRRTLDTEFHLQMAKMAKNPFLVQMIKQFYENIYFNISFIYMSPLIEKFKNDHKLLFEALRSKNLKEGRKILRNHNREARACIHSMVL